MDKSQLLLVVGIGLFAWIMLRNKLRRSRQNSDINHDLEHIQRVANSSVKNLTLANGPPETARLQAALLDLQRELLGELDTRTAAVRALMVQADSKIALLRELSGVADPASAAGEDAPPNSAWIQECTQLSNSGWPADQIARYLGRPLGDVELELSLIPAYRSLRQ